MSQEKTIRFIDTNYRTLFTLPDGGNLRMIFPDGKSKVSRCRYVDEYHTEVAGRVYHICEFAGHMERGGIACAPEEPLPRQTDKQAFQERRFLRAPFGAYAIYQLTREEATRNLRFEPLEHLRAAGLAVDRANYDLVYTGALPSRPDLSREALLESLYERFNLDPPRDFTGHSLSVSDVVGLKGKSGVSFHYVDSFGFAELPAFLPAPDKAMEEASRAAELAEQPFELVFLVMDPGYRPDNRRLIEENAELLGIPITIFDSDIFDVPTHVEKNPCYLCARMRRGFLYSKARELGCGKIALGHHFSDVIETTLLGLFYGAQLQAMPPRLRSKNFPGMELIRPLYCVHEDAIIA